MQFVVLTFAVCQGEGQVRVIAARLLMVLFESKWLLMRWKRCHHRNEFTDMK